MRPWALQAESFCVPWTAWVISCQDPSHRDGGRSLGDVAQLAQGYPVGKERTQGWTLGLALYPWVVGTWLTEEMAYG